MDGNRSQVGVLLAQRAFDLLGLHVYLAQWNVRVKKGMQDQIELRVRIVGARTVDGVVCLSDELALGVIRALHGTEKENLIVTGYDDLSTAEHFGITSISQERAVRAKWAVDEILAAETRELTDYPSCYRMPSILKCRRSCGCTEGGTTHVCPESPE